MILYVITKNATGQVVLWGGQPLRGPEAGETAHTLEEATKNDQVIIGAAKPQYTKVVDGHFVAMTPSEKAVVTQAQVEEKLKERILPPNYAHTELTVSSTASGLVITTTISELQITDKTTIEADSSLTKYVLLSLLYSAAEGFHMYAYEKTDGDYASLDAEHYLVQQDISEWYVVANGDTLVEVT